MPTFGLPEDFDVLPQDVDSYFRHFLGTSTHYLKQKKFIAAHEKELAVVLKKNSDRDFAKRKARQEFEERRKRHKEAFQETNTRSEILDDVADVDLSNVSIGWYHEYEHPSSTANISGEGIVHEKSPKKDISSINLVLDAKHEALFDTSLNCSLGSFSDLSSVSKPSDNVTLAGLKLSTTAVPKGIFSLDSYTGARPSFGGSLQTSTPYNNKIIKKLDAVPEDGKLFSLPDDKENAVTTSVPVAQPVVRTDSATIKTFESRSFDKLKFPQLLKYPDTEQPKEISVSETKHSLISYYSREVDKKEDNDIARDRFERRNAAVRSSLKRTIIEKMSLIAKKYAKPEELNEAVAFFNTLLSGLSVVGSSNVMIALADPDALCYAKNVLIDHCMGLIERDISLVSVLSNLLRSLIESHEDFGTLLAGKLLAASVLLTNDIDKCSKFVTHLSQQPGDLKTFTMNKEKSIVKLFCYIHILGKRCGSNVFSPANLWRLLAHVINSPYCVLSTVLILNVVVESLSTLYPNQWPKIVNFLRCKMLPEMERGLLNVEERRIAGEAVYISLFRDALDAF